MKRRKDGRYQKVVTIDGKKHFFYSTASTERAAERDIQKQLVEYQEKEHRTHLFTEVAAEWEKEYLKKIPYHNYKKDTKAKYEHLIDYFDGMYVEEITAVETNQYINLLISRGYSRKTISGYKSTLNKILTYALMQGMIKYNPVHDIRLPNNLPKHPRELPTTPELKTVSQHYEGFDLLPFFMLYSGCRKSEALAITKDELDFKNKRINIRNHVIHDGNTPIYEPVLKSDAAHRDIIMLDRLYDVLPRKFSGFLFSMDGDGKRPLTKCAYDKRMTQYCKRLGIKVGAHQLRHGFATMLYEAGVDEKDAQELMGHSDILLTRRIYTHIRNERKNKTAKKLNKFHF